jgi:hypothetical protein
MYIISVPKAFIVDALGTEFIKPIIIGHHRKPRCFKNVWCHKAFCSYFYNITITQAIMNIYKAWRTVKVSTIVNCWRKADILINNNDYFVELNNL